MNFNARQKASLLAMATYIFLASLKLSLAGWLSSASLYADGLNNLTDIIASATVFIGLWIAKKPADSDHHFGHARYETLSSFIVSLIMMFLGFQVIMTSIQQLQAGNIQPPKAETVGIALLTAGVLWLSYRQVFQTAQASQSIGLKATAEDMRNDLLVNLTPILGYGGSYIGLPQLDLVLSLGVGGMIIYSAFDIFKETSFVLSDGFDQASLASYRAAILTHPQVLSVYNMRGRIAGQGVYLDITIEVDPNMTVEASHQVTEELEDLLIARFDVVDVDIHVEPEGYRSHKQGQK